MHEICQPGARIGTQDLTSWAHRGVRSLRAVICLVSSDNVCPGALRQTRQPISGPMIEYRARLDLDEFSDVHCKFTEIERST